jgi:hypothetical protein
MRPLALSLLALVFAACDTVGFVDRNEVNVYELTHDADALVGTWDLVTVTPSGECMGEDCTRTRPAEELGQSARVTFRADGTATYVYGDWTLADGAFEVRYHAYGNGTQSDAPQLYIGDERFNFGIDEDRLYFDDRYVDGPLLEFARQ